MTTTTNRAMTANLLSWYAMATPVQRERGSVWYAQAYAEAAAIAAETGFSADKVCAVIAVLSPRCAWAANKRAARLVCHSVRSGYPPIDRLALPGVWGANVRKAHRILTEVSVGQVCAGCTPAGNHRAGCTAALRGAKVVAFYRAIANAGNADGAIDIWAVRAALTPPSKVCGQTAQQLNARQRSETVPAGQTYARILRAYQGAANAAGVECAHMQAVVWETVRAAWVRADGRRQGVRRETWDDQVYREVTQGVRSQ